MDIAAVRIWQQLLFSMLCYFAVNLIWVPCHRSILVNCVGDELAKAGTLFPDSYLLVGAGENTH